MARLQGAPTGSSPALASRRTRCAPWPGSPCRRRCATARGRGGRHFASARRRSRWAIHDPRVRDLQGRRDPQWLEGLDSSDARAGWRRRRTSLEQRRGRHARHAASATWASAGSRSSRRCCPRCVGARRRRAHGSRHRPRQRRLRGGGQRHRRRTRCTATSGSCRPAETISIEQIATHGRSAATAERAGVGPATPGDAGPDDADGTDDRTDDGDGDAGCVPRRQKPSAPATSARRSPSS